MNRTFIQTKEFSKAWDSLGFNDDDLRMLELEIMTNPTKAPIMKGTGGLRKLRFSRDNKGKSGGVRVCYIDFIVEETVYLITVYPKNVKDNLTEEERNNIKNAIKLLKQSL